jgi:hypothetical protein
MLAPRILSELEHRPSLIKILQMAYSGERAAAFAYQGHWRSVRDVTQQQAIRKIEDDEWLHRHDVGQMLTILGATPVWWREWLMACIGRTVSIGCFIIGWFFPMYLAGQLESNNVSEYDDAATHARALELHQMAAQLTAMAETERAHEAFFVNEVILHRWLPLANRIFGWHPENRLRPLPAPNSIEFESNTIGFEPITSSVIANDEIHES